MKVTFYSNYLNHHQLPFCLSMYRRLGDKFRFIATTPINSERVLLGYEDMNKKYPFVLTTYDNQQNEIEAMRLAAESDVIIHGSAPEKYIKKRIKNGKLTFRYSERAFKRGRKHILNPKRIGGMLLHHTYFSRKNVYMLCASAYTAGDMAMVGAYLGRTFKWGYFPEAKSYNLDEMFSQKSEKPLLLWCGRFLKLKHPEKAVLVAERLKQEGYDFDLQMLGAGEEQERIKKMIEEKKVEDRVSLLGSVPAKQVREYMEKANIFLFTSDQNEGWGAVLNESMNSGCAVVASKAIGSVPFLMQDGENGLVYEDKDFEDLYRKVKFLMDNPEKRDEYGKNAYKTMTEHWSAEVAAERIIELAKQLPNKNAFKDGPCSRAKLM